jgi:hypothetical protein
MRGSVIEKANTAVRLLTHLGPRWCTFRALYALKRRLGYYERRLPFTTWQQEPLRSFLPTSLSADPARFLKYRQDGDAPRFFFRPSDRAAYTDLLSKRFPTHAPSASSRHDSQADALRHGELLYFSQIWGHTGFPPEWHRNPFTGQVTPTDRHWSRIDDFGQGDIKVIWEPNRFGFVYDLVRSYWRTADEQIPDLFWQLIEDWQERNPPQAGANWKCGQEISFRVMAWCFGLFGFLEAATTTPERVARCAHMIAISGKRIEANLSYALSQKNNHSISEGMGLWTIGLLFPEFREARRWRDRGQAVLEDQGRKLIYEDGAFAQHSLNYHRLMLHDYAWSVRLGDLNDQSFSSELKERLRRAGHFLFQLQDETSGEVPVYGQNDGALILPLNNCPYHDFRPVISVTQFLTSGTRPYASGIWDEDLLWLFGPDSLGGPAESSTRTDLKAEIGGYYTLRSGSGFLFTRCATFRHRPGQADMLHADIWWRGQNIAVDAGTYSANAAEPWGEAFGGTECHNTVSVDGLDQMERAGRFLWLPWARGSVKRNVRSQGGKLAYFEGRHDGYERLSAPVTHRRAILQLGNEHWLVVDHLESEAEHAHRLHWLLCDVPNEWDESTGTIRLRTMAGEYQVQAKTLTGAASSSLVRAVRDSARGWRARFYGDRESALSLALEQRARHTRFCSFFGPTPTQVSFSVGRIMVETELSRFEIGLGVGTGSLVREARMDGTLEDLLQIEG